MSIYSPSHVDGHARWRLRAKHGRIAAILKQRVGVLQFALVVMKILRVLRGVTGIGREPAISVLKMADGRVRSLPVTCRGKDVATVGWLAIFPLGAAIKDKLRLVEICLLAGNFVAVHQRVHHRDRVGGVPVAGDWCSGIGIIATPLTAIDDTDGRA